MAASEIQDNTAPTKRVVVHIVSGKRAGMRKIIGHLVCSAGEDFPPSIANVDLGTHAADVQHAGTFPRYILYREFKQAAKGKFNNFNPAQL